MERSRALRVLQSVPRPRPTTNPYVVQLVGSLPPDVQAEWFSWRRALLGRYDVLHVHWPEVALRRGSAPARAAARLRFALLVLRLGLLRTPVVRTLHNTGSHEGGPRVERLLLRWFDRRTTRWVLLNEDTPTPDPARSAVVLHGDYASWFAGRAVPERVPGRLLHFGLVRPYKGVDALLAAVAATDDPQVSLRVVGHPTTPELRQLVLDAEAADPRVSSRLEYVDDAVLAHEVGEAELVVLPYREMHNSGALLLALSLRRPVLVPATPTTRRLAQEVGEQWVITCDGAPGAEDLLAALRAAAALDVDRDGPDLGRRSWPQIGEQHAAVYRAALAGR